MTFVNIDGLNVDLSAFSPSNQGFIRLVADLENTEQAEAAVSPAPPQPASTAVPTDASGVGKPEVSSPPRPSSRPPPLPPSLPPSLSFTQPSTPSSPPSTEPGFGDSRRGQPTAQPDGQPRGGRGVPARAVLDRRGTG